MTNNKLLHLNAITSKFSARTKPQTPIVFIIDCNSDMDVTDLADIIQTQKPTFIVLPNQSYDKQIEISEKITVITDKRDLSAVFDIYESMNVDITAIVSDYDFDTELFKTNIETIKKNKPKLAIVHGQNGNETDKLIELFDYGAKHGCTINNNFEQLIKKDSDRALISIFDIRTLRNRPLQSEYGQILISMGYSAYFDSRFNSFGLHSHIENKKLIVIDYEYLYDVMNFAILKIENLELVVVKQLPNDPFPLLSKQLSRRAYNSKEKTINVTIEDRLFAAHIRKNLKTIFEERNEAAIEATKELLSELNMPTSKKNINIYSKLITCNTPNTLITEFDRDCFKLLHHSPHKFLNAARKDMNIFFAKDIYNSRLYFELAKSDKYEAILAYFLTNSHPLIFDPKSTDSSGMTILEVAATYNSPKNIIHLHNYGADINYVSPFRFTALDRALSNDAAIAAITLEIKGGKVASEVD